MTVPGAPASLLNSLLTGQNVQQEMGVRVLKKAQDAMKQQGEDLVQMLDAIGTQSTETGKALLDTYA